MQICRFADFLSVTTVRAVRDLHRFDKIRRNRMTLQNAVPEEKELIKKLQKGDREAWERLFLEEARGIIALALRRGLNKEEAEEICQEAFIKLVYHLRSPRALEWVMTKGGIGSYLRTIAHYEIIGFIRRKDWRAPVPSVDDLADEEVLIDMIASPYPNPEERVLQKEGEQQEEERVGALIKAIEELAPKDRRLINLLLDGYTSAEIAQRLGLSAKAVSSRRHRILTQLKTKLAEGLGEEYGTTQRKN